MHDPIVLDGRHLTVAQVHAIAGGAAVAVDAAATDRMRAGRAVVERYLRERIPAYGITTGLGMRADVMLTEAEATAFSYRAVRGRAHGIGEALSEPSVRAVMAARLNTLLTGESGGSPELARFLVEALNRRLLPEVPRVGSIGAGDLVAMATLARALIGEGRTIAGGESVSALDGLAAIGMAPLVLQPKDGTVLANNTAFSAGIAALATVGARSMVQALQVAGALSLEGFRGGVTPFEPAVVRARPQPGQVRAGDELWALLDGGRLHERRPTRRLQDPLSFRCMAQMHGAVHVAVDHLEEAVTVELNSSSDNPLVLVGEDRCVTTGNFHLPLLAQALDGVSRALAWAATDSVSRVQRLASAALSGLAPMLSSHDADRAGFGPLLKTAEALRAQIIHRSAPVPILPSHNADGVEDSATFAALAAQNLDDVLHDLRLMVAIELLAGCQAVDLHGDRIAHRLHAVYDRVRVLSPSLTDDRPLGDEIELVALHLGEVIAGE